MPMYSALSIAALVATTNATRFFWFDRGAGSPPGAERRAFCMPKTVLCRVDARCGALTLMAAAADRIRGHCLADTLANASVSKPCRAHRARFQGAI